MPSAKALAAIALTLIIVVPIGLGYLMAIDKEPADAWETSTSSNISDLLINNQAPYFASYKGTTNNSTLINGGIYAPNYVETTTNYSSLPTYTTVNTTTTGTTTTYTGIPGEEIGYGADIGAGAYHMPERDVYHITACYIGVQSTEYPDGTDFDWGVEEAYLVRDSASTWTCYWYYEDSGQIQAGQPIVGISQWVCVGYPPGSGSTRSVTVDAWDMVAPHTAGTTFASVSSTPSTVLIDSIYYPVESLNLFVSPGSVKINGTEYTYETDPTVYIGVAGSVVTTSTTLSGSYANPTLGWTLPSLGTAYDWYNAQLNNSATFYIWLPAGHAVFFNESLELDRIGDTIYIKKDSDDVATLGNYAYAQIVVSSTGYTVSGLSGWPNMGTPATTYNTVTVDDTLGNFREVSLKAVHVTGTVSSPHFRVDNANSLAGYYPDTLNLTFDPNTIYPGTNLDIYLNSIGVYGDTLTIGGESFTVDKTNGSISVDGQTVRLRHAHITAWQTDSGYAVKINGVDVTETANLPTIYFGGEWSITATAYQMEKTTVMQTVWHAGVFGFDKTSIGAAGLLTALGCLIVLGMTGARSGTKIGLLLLVCGGAAIVLLTLL